MSQSDSKRTGGSELSAEAESFVPSHLKNPTTTAQQSGMEGGGSGSRPETPTDLPHYVTNCYPFVSQDNTDSAIRNTAVWQQKTLPIHASTSQNAHLHTRLPPPGMFTFTGSRPPGLPGQQLPSNNIRHVRPPHQQQPIFRQPLPTRPMSSSTSNPLQQQGLLPTPPIPPLLPNMAQRPPLLSPGATAAVPGMLPYRMPLQSLQGTNPVLHQMGLVGQTALLNQGLFPGGTNVLGNVLAGTSLLGTPPGSSQGATNTGKTGGNKGKNKKKSKEWQSSVSTGTQNEGNRQQLDGISKKKNRPKTLMCRDATSQTDFCDDIANKTLAERPSSLFQKERTRNWPELYQDSSTDSEEVDSDSGYSSPKRNQASSGTHPLTGTQPQPPVGYIPEIVPFSNVQYSSVLTEPGTSEMPSFGRYAQAVAGVYKKALQSAGSGNSGPGSLAGLIKACTGSVDNPVNPHNSSGTFISSNNNDTSASPKLSQASNAQPPHTINSGSSIISGRSKSAKTRKKKSDKQNILENSGLGSINDMTTAVSNSSTSSNTLLFVDSSSRSSSSSLLTSSVVSMTVPSSSLGGSGQTTTTLSCDSNQDESVLSGHQSSNYYKSDTSIATSKTGGGDGEDSEGATGSRRKRKRSRKHKKKHKSSGDASLDRKGGTQSDGGTSGVLSTVSSDKSSSLAVDSTHSVACDILHFEDENEFPDLLSAAGGLSDSQTHITPSLSYSDILKGQQSHHALSQESAHSFSSGGFKSSPDTASVKSSKEDKYARRRRKRQEKVDLEVTEELAEISLEQEVLRELSVKPHQDNDKKKPTGKRTKQPISLSIADMITALEEQQQQKEKEALLNPNKHTNSTSAASKSTVSNILDSSAPKKRGKEREVPKVKKPSPMKKIILKEREEKKRLRLLDEGVDIGSNPGDVSSTGLGVIEPNNNHEQQQDSSHEFEDQDYEEEEEEEEEEVVESAGEDEIQDANSNRSSLEIGTGTTASADLSPISQTSPVSMSPPSGSPSGSGFSSPVSGDHPTGRRLSSSVATRIHSRRFREYCTQVLDKEIDSCCTVLLQELVRFQDRMYHRDPTKSKSKRRIVLGIRECAKHLKLKKLKCVVISPNLERIQSKGGLDDALNGIIAECQQQSVPFVFALGRRALGRACAKLVPVSVVGIFNYEGCEEYYHKMVELTSKARESYKEMVDIIEKEILEQSPSSMPPPLVASYSGSSAGGSIPGTTGQIGDVQKFFPHLGHSRTPSACSAISFCSSILSEPISENYPHSEPETDSRGYEIVKDKSQNSGTDALREKLDKIERDVGEEFDLEGGEGQLQMVETLNEIDEGHEADTEDNPHGHVQKKFVHPWAEDSDSKSKSGGGGKGDTSSGMGSSDPDDTCYEEMGSKEAEVESKGRRNSGENVHGKENVVINNGGEVFSEVKLCNSNTNSSIKDSGQGIESDNDEHFKDFDEDTIEDLPHMESVHTNNNFNVISDYSSSDILSQQSSSRTLDLSTEATSTHSSKTIENTTETNARRNSGILVGMTSSSSAETSATQKVKTLDKERIESWVIDAQKQIKLIGIKDEEETVIKVYSEVNGVLEDDEELDVRDGQREICDRENNRDQSYNIKDELSAKDSRSNSEQFTDNALLCQGSKVSRHVHNNSLSSSDENTIVSVTNELQNNHHCSHRENSASRLENNKRTLSTTAPAKS